MKILAHRGLWKVESEKNMLLSFENAFRLGFGIETDIRDMNGTLVISHNPPVGTALKLSELLELWSSYDSRPTLALNIKADGLYLTLNELLLQYEIKKDHYFLFDASVPEQYVYLKREYNIFTRSSEFESESAFFEKCNGVWLDQFTNCKHIEQNLKKLLASKKEVVVVSPELHSRENTVVWKLLHHYKDVENLSLCTDKPIEAEEYFR